MRGRQSAADTGAAVPARCSPGPQTKGRVMHWLASTAPCVTVVLGGGQAPHTLRDCPPTAMLYVPRGQGEQAGLPCRAKVPASQAAHCGRPVKDSEVAPVALELVPAAQGRHVALELAPAASL